MANFRHFPDLDTSGMHDPLLAGVHGDMCAPKTHVGHGCTQSAISVISAFRRSRIGCATASDVNNLLAVFGKCYRLKYLKMRTYIDTDRV